MDKIESYCFTDKRYFLWKQLKSKYKRSLSVLEWNKLPYSLLPEVGSNVVTAAAFYAYKYIHIYIHLLFHLFFLDKHSRLYIWTGIWYLPLEGYLTPYQLEMLTFPVIWTTISMIKWFFMPIKFLLHCKMVCYTPTATKKRKKSYEN